MSDMAEKNYSEDYEMILIYKQSLSSENFSEIKTKTVNFFFEKYKELINKQYSLLKYKLSLGSNFDGKLDYEETKDFSIEIPPQEKFDVKIKVKYIPQALNSFKPEIITNKNDYCFATYLYNYFRHAVRDFATKWRKNSFNANSLCDTSSVEEKFIDAEEAERIRNKITELKNYLTPFEIKVFDFLIEGKKQKDMLLMNEELKKPYTKGYISKIVKKIRIKMARLLEEK